MLDASKHRLFLLELEHRADQHGSARTVNQADPTTELSLIVDHTDRDIHLLRQVGLVGPDYHGKFFVDRRPCTTFFTVEPSWKPGRVKITIISL